MIRLSLVFVAVVIVAISLALPNYAAIGLSVGILMGTAFFMMSLAGGNGIRGASLSPDKENRYANPDASIGAGMAAAGIGVAAQANPNYPVSFHYFFIAAAVAGCALALFFAWKSRKPQTEKK